jgi:hypothetical protein
MAGILACGWPNGFSFAEISFPVTNLGASLTGAGAAPVLAIAAPNLPLPQVRQNLANHDNGNGSNLPALMSSASGKVVMLLPGPRPAGRRME